MNLLRNIGKYLFRAIVLPLIILVAAGIILFNLIPQAEIRKYAAHEVGQRIGRQIELGVVHLGLRGLHVDSLKVSEVPSFDSGLLCDAKGIHFGWALRSLWKGLDFRKRTLTSSSGSFKIDDFKNPFYQAKDFSVSWSLTGLGGGNTHLNGWAKLDQGEGLLRNVDKLIAKSPAAKVALAPVQALMNLEKLGILKLGLPDLKHWPIQGIKGRYTFKEGLMTMDPFTIASPQLGMKTTGTVDLPSGNLLLDAHLDSPKTSAIGAMDATLRISGTTANPKVDLSHLTKKAFQATLNNILQNPKDAKKNVGDALKNLFH